MHGTCGFFIARLRRRRIRRGLARLDPAVEVEPSLYAADFARLGEQLEELLDAGARVFHFDVGDGHFVPPVTIGPVVLRSIAPLVHEAGGVLDCHLMVDDPAHHFPEIAASGGDSVTFHVEATDDAGAVIAAAREHGLGVGVAFNPDDRAWSAAAAAATGAPTSCSACRSSPATRGSRSCRGAAADRAARGARRRAPSRSTAASARRTSRAVRDAGADLLVAGSALFAATTCRAPTAGSPKRREHEPRAGARARRARPRQRRTRTRPSARSSSRDGEVVGEGVARAQGVGRTPRSSRSPRPASAPAARRST